MIERQLLDLAALLRVYIADADTGPADQEAAKVVLADVRDRLRPSILLYAWVTKR